MLNVNHIIVFAGSLPEQTRCAGNEKKEVNRSFGIDTRIFAARIQRQWV